MPKKPEAKKAKKAKKAQKAQKAQKSQASSNAGPAGPVGQAELLGSAVLRAPLYSTGGLIADRVYCLRASGLTLLSQLRARDQQTIKTPEERSRAAILYCEVVCLIAATTGKYSPVHGGDPGLKAQAARQYDALIQRILSFQKHLCELKGHALREDRMQLRFNGCLQEFLTLTSNCDKTFLPNMRKCFGLIFKKHQMRTLESLFEAITAINGDQSPQSNQGSAAHGGAAPAQNAQGLGGDQGDSEDHHVDGDDLDGDDLDGDDLDGDDLDGDDPFVGAGAALVESYFSAVGELGADGLSISHQSSLSSQELQELLYLSSAPAAAVRIQAHFRGFNARKRGHGSEGLSEDRADARNSDRDNDSEEDEMVAVMHELRLSSASVDRGQVDLLNSDNDSEDGANAPNRDSDSNRLEVIVRFLCIALVVSGGILWWFKPEGLMPAVGGLSLNMPIYMALGSGAAMLLLLILINKLHDQLNHRFGWRLSIRSGYSGSCYRCGCVQRSDFITATCSSDANHSDGNICCSGCYAWLALLLGCVWLDLSICAQSMQMIQTVLL